MSWSDFEKKKEDQKPQKIDHNLASLFSSPEGEKVLNWLRLRTKEVVLPPNAPESALRHLEGMRHLVHEIETRIARGKGNDAREYRQQLGRKSSPSRKRKRSPFYARWFK